MDKTAMSQYAFVMKAPAKINYVLEIGEKRKDGFHEISTIFQTISLSDELFFAETPKEIDVKTDSEELANTEQNIVFKAATLLKRVKGVNKGAKIFLKKNIPIKSGLGGGSSDAACALRGLSRLWNLNMPDEELIKFAVQLGADVPFFLKGGMAIGKGKGEKLSYIRAGMKPKLSILVICPAFGVSSAEAYRFWDMEGYTSRGAGLDDFMKALYKNDLLGIAANLYNDFEAPIFKLHPQIRMIKSTLIQNGALGALMTGSGSAVYGIFNNQELMEQLAEKMGSYGKVFKVSTI